MTLPLEHEKEPKSLKIQQYFAGTNVFITGATGFIGKLLLEKLLRTCTDIKRVYILIREKKNKSIEKRFEEILDNVIFEVVKQEQPKFVNKIVLVNGDCALPGLGITEEDETKLSNEVNIVFHCAATVRFNETIWTAAYINVRGTRDILNLSKKMKHLKSFVYVSTAYSHCIRKNIKEEFYDTNLTAEKLQLIVDNLDNKILEDITPKLIGNWPNTYVFTKAVAENVVKTEGKGLPVAVVRPSVVISTAQEPLPGWIDNMYGITGITLGVAVGLIHTLYCRKHFLAEIVPADYVINCIIAAAWDVGVMKGSNANKELTYAQSVSVEEKHEGGIPIYNYVSSTQAKINWQAYLLFSERYLTQIPSPLIIWTYWLFLNSNYYMHMLCVVLLHRIPGYIVDFCACCVGKKPFLVKGYAKIDKYMNALQYFSTHQWKFSSDNVQILWKKLNEDDKKLFRFDMNNFDWDCYFESYAKGIRVYLLKDPMDTLPQGKMKYWILKIAHYTLIGLLLWALLKLLGMLWSWLF